MPSTKDFRCAAGMNTKVPCSPQMRRIASGWISWQMNTALLRDCNIDPLPNTVCTGIGSKNLKVNGTKPLAKPSMQPVQLSKQRRRNESDIDPPAVGLPDRRRL